MTRWVGEAGLWLGVACSAAMLIGGVLGGTIGVGRGGWGRLARCATIGNLAALVGAGGALVAAFLGDDMRLAAVALHSERALPAVYKLAAVWAGQEGSLLLWTLVLAACGAVAATRGWGGRRADRLSVGVLGALGLFFTLLMLGGADPFALDLRGPLEDGVGLNPVLQHWAMVVHPPLLFLGYGCAAGAFAVAVGALAAGDVERVALASVGRWALASWGFLTGGILLGAWWAYVELGWGGYWAWDPVENASLMPWLAVTGVVHSVLISRERGSMRGWGLGLACLAFALCVMGTTLTRSGLLVSVHAFGATTVGRPLAGLLGAVVLGAGWLLWRRRGLLRAGGAPEGLLRRDGAVVVLNLLLSGMLVAVLAGTLFPVVSGAVFGHQVGVGAPYYSRVVGSLGLAAACVMAVSPVLGYGEGSGARALAASGVLAVAGAGVAAGLGVVRPAALVCVAIATVTPVVICGRLVGEVSLHRAPGGGWLGGAARAVSANRRRYGAHLAHAGVAVLLVGVCGSGLYAERTRCTVARGAVVEAAGYTVEYRGLSEVRGANYSAMRASVLATDGRGRAVWLSPERRYYDRAMEPVTEVAVHRRAAGDLYVVLAGWSAGGGEAALLVVSNPLAVWVWVGGAAMVAGGGVAWLARGPRGAKNTGGVPDGPSVGTDGSSSSARRAPGAREGSIRP